MDLRTDSMIKSQAAFANPVPRGTALFQNYRFGVSLVGLAVHLEKLASPLRLLPIRIVNKSIRRLSFKTVLSTSLERKGITFIECKTDKLSDHHVVVFLPF